MAALMAFMMVFTISVVVVLLEKKYHIIRLTATPK